MKPLPIKLSKETLIVCLIVFIGFVLRFYAATTVPLVHDEYEKISVLNKISFSSKNFSIPFGDTLTHNPTLLPILMKLSTLIFGISNLAYRIPSIILGTLTLPIFYVLIKQSTNRSTATTALIFLSFSQYAIGGTRIVWEDGILLFFTSLILLFIQKALRKKKPPYLWLAAITFGIGLHIKITLLTLAPPVILYVFFYSKHKKIFPKTHLALFLMIIVSINVPHIAWNFTNNNTNYTAYAQEAKTFQFSLVPYTLFLGEIFTSLPHLSEQQLFFLTSFEYPFMDAILGSLCFFAAFYIWMLKRTPFTNFLILFYYSHLIFLSFLYPKSGGGAPLHFDNFWWAGIMIIPGIVFAAIVIDHFNGKHPKTKILTYSLICYLFYNAIHFVSFPANCFLPNKNMQLKELQQTARYYLHHNQFKKQAQVLSYIEKHYR